MERMTRRTVLASLGVALPVLAACGAERSAGPSLQVSKPVTVTAWFPVTGNYAPYLQSQTDLFQQGNEKVKVTIEPSGARTAAGGDRGGRAPGHPAVQLHPHVYVGPAGGPGGGRPVPGQAREGGLPRWASEGSSIAGKMYEWPWMLNPTGPVINEHLPQKDQGACCPSRGWKADWTFDQWKQLLVQATTRAGPQTGTSTAPPSWGRPPGTGR